MLITVILTSVTVGHIWVQGQSVLVKRCGYGEYNYTTYYDYDCLPWIAIKEVTVAKRSNLKTKR